MPTRTLRRQWCKICNSYELFEQHYPNWDDWFCKKCENAYVKVDLSEIPEELKVQQRKRYNENPRNQDNSVYVDFFGDPAIRQRRELLRMFSPPGEDIEYEEDDAGQHEINEEIRKERHKQAEERRLEKERVIEELLKYKGTRRNDKCPCNSGKKYKKCCIIDVEQKLIKYHLRF